MQVGCSQCGAKYEFEASAIPAGGYDAQCTSCGNVFFVSPEGPAPDANALVTVTCASCGALYQFAASAIPPGGYDAQCTQCHAVFFVSPAGAAPPRPPEQPVAAAMPAPTPPIEEAVELTSSGPAVQELEPELVSGATEATAISPAPAGLADEMALANGAPAIGDPSSSDAAIGVGADTGSGGEVPAAASQSDAADMIDLADSLGDPAAAPVEPGRDFEVILHKRRLRLRVALGALAGVAVAVAGLYFLAPRLFDMTVGRVVGIKLTVDPAAVPLCEQAQPRFFEDTEAGYTAALGLLDQALAIDSAYPDALAYAALSHAFRAVDLQVLGRERHDHGLKAAAELKALGGGSSSAARLDELRRSVAEDNAAATELFERAGKDMAEALALLKKGMQGSRNSPIINEAAGLYYATDSDGLVKAGELLRYALELRGTAALDLAKPPDAFIAYLQGKLWAASSNETERPQAAGALQAAIRTEPRLVRARYDLARELSSHQQAAEAKRLLGELLAAAPEHPKAKGLLASLDGSAVLASKEPAAAAPVAVAAPEPKAKPGKAKKQKGKRRH
jgi:hypothetical protein